jgi:TRAP transporter TAXI family solute receptor
VLDAKRGGYRHWSRDQVPLMLRGVGTGESMRRIVLGAVAGGLALIAGLAGAIYWYERPTVVRVGVTRDSEDQKVIAAAAQIMSHERENVRMRVIGLDSPSAAAAAFNAGEIDLAVTRTDINMPKDGQTIVILSRSPAVVFAPGGSTITSVNDLKGKRVAVVVPRPEASANVRLLDYILSRYNIPVDAITRVPMTLNDLRTAITEKRIDAVFAVGPPGIGLLSDAVTAVSEASEGALVFVPMNEGKAIAQLSPTLEPFEVPRGTFGGAPARPARDITTISVSTRLVARESLRNSVVSDITRIMFNNRPAIAVSAPSANLMSAPPTEKGSALPTHPGAAAYIDGEEETFIDRYGDYFYIGAMVLSVLASAAAALASRFSAESHARIENVFEDLLTKLLQDISRARDCSSRAELDYLERDADVLLGDALKSGGARGLDAHRIAALGLGLDQLRAAINVRRKALDGEMATAAFEPPRIIGQGR